jgi:hypothetical protein
VPISGSGAWVTGIEKVNFVKKAWRRRVMKITRICIVAIIMIIAVALSASPAFAWYWPILGFGPGPYPPPSNDSVPFPIQPGTSEWLNMPSGPAHLVEPGYAFGLNAFLDNRICFNSIPIFGTPAATTPINYNFGNTTPK